MTAQRAGTIAALAYAAGAGWVTYSEQVSPSGFLAHLGSFFVTLPITGPMAWLGMEPDFNSRAQVAGLVIANTLLVYRATAAIAHWLIRRR